MGELTGTRRRFSVVKLPEAMAQALGIPASEAEITIEHYDEGLSSSEIPYITALWQIKDKESKRGGK